MSDPLTIWHICDNPPEHPGKIVVVKQTMENGQTVSSEEIPCDTLEEARSKLPRGLVKLSRAPDDCARLIECWI